MRPAILSDRGTHCCTAATQERRPWWSNLRFRRIRAVVHDDARIEDVVAKVLAEAKRAGLSAAIAEPVWRVLIARSIAHEFEMFDAKNSVAQILGPR